MTEPVMTAREFWQNNPRFWLSGTNDDVDQIHIHQAMEAYAAARLAAQPADCPECRRLAALNNELTAELGLEVAAFENLQAECRRLREAMEKCGAGIGVRRRTMSEATQIVHWPGKDTPACDEHLQKLVGLGAVLGIRVSWTPCEPTVCTNCQTELRRDSATGEKEKEG